MTPFALLIGLVLFVLCVGAFVLLGGLIYFFGRKKGEDRSKVSAVRSNMADSPKPAVEKVSEKKENQPTAPSSALEKFQKSMDIGYIQWHDGDGYDLDALRQLSGKELERAESLLISRKDSDWRDVEALATLKTPRAIEALKECLSSPNIDVRLFAVRYLKEMNIEDRVEEVVVKTLPETKIGQGLTYALALAKDYPTEAIKQKLLWCCVHGNDDIRVHCAAMALFLYGKAASEFDREQTIVFRFRDKDEAKRLEAFSELSRIIKE